MPFDNAVTAAELRGKVQQIRTKRMCEYAETMLLSKQAQTLLSNSLSEEDGNAARTHRKTVNDLNKRMDFLAAGIAADDLIAAKRAADRALAASQRNIVIALRSLRVDGVSGVGTPAGDELGVSGCAEGYPPCIR